MRTTNFDVIAASAPLNREASVARDGSGETWGFEVHEQISHWKAPPLPTHRRPHGMSDLSGRSFGLLKVLRFHGYREGKNAPALWLVRCSCGDYETRRHAKLVKGGDPNDRCVVCKKAEALRKRASRTPTKKDLRRQRAAFARIVGEESR